MLMQARRERVAWFYETNRVQVGPKVTKKEETAQEDFKEILQEVFLEAFRNHFNKLMHVQKNNKNYYLLYMRDNEINLPNFTFKRNVW